MSSTLISHCDTSKLTRDALLGVPVPETTRTHQPVPHHDIVSSLVETLSFRHIAVVRDEYAVSPDGMRMFGVLDLEVGMEGCRFSIGVRNANDKTMRLALTIGYRVIVCDNMAFHGDFTPVLAKHSKSFSLVDSLSVGVDRMQRNFAPMRQDIERWRESQISDATAKLLIYHAFVESELDAPKHLLKVVHENYFQPQHFDFQPRTIWSLSNAFTSAFQRLEPIPQFRATARLGQFFKETRLLT